VVLLDTTTPGWQVVYSNNSWTKLTGEWTCARVVVVALVMVMAMARGGARAGLGLACEALVDQV
jgi:hypothetical protein